MSIEIPAPTALEQYKSQVISNGIRFYEPHPGQLFFHKSTAKIRGLFGGNRELAYGTLVRMADGSAKAIEDLVIGDMVLSWDGEGSVPSMVVAIPYDDYSEALNVFTAAGLRVIGSYDHCFPIRSMSCVTQIIRKRTLEEVGKFKNSVFFLNGGIQHYKRSDCPPFSGLLLGLFLGDGSYGKSPSTNYARPNFTNTDPWIRQLFTDEIKAYYPELLCLSYPHDDTRLYVRFAKGFKNQNRFINDLKKHDITHKCESKYIPDCFKYANPNTRRSIIRGLILTDGCVDKYKVSIYSNSIRMLEDVSEILVSLGGRSKIYKDSEPANKNQNQQYVLQFSVDFIRRLHIGDLGRKNPKYSLIRKPRRDDLLVAGALPVGSIRCRCIEVDHPSHTFVLANGIVTYNSGKTTATKAETALFVTHSQRFRPRPMRPVKILCGSESNEYNRDIIVPKLRRFIPPSLVVNEVRIGRGFIDYWQLKDGSTIKFKNYEQDADKWAGDDYDLIDLDEEPPYDIWVECKMRTIDRGGEIILGMTPIKGLTWVYTDVWEKKGTTGIEAWLMDMDLNPHLKKEDKDQVLVGLTDQEIKIRKEGKFVALHGLVYPMFDEKKHTIEPFDIPAHWRKVVAVDPHLKKPTSVLWLAMAQEAHGRISKGDWVVYRELKRNGIIPDIVASIQVASGRERIYARIGDPALNIKDNITGVSPFDEFAACGFSLISANKAVESGIYEIRKLLEQNPPGLWIFNTCPTLVWEFRHYSFADIEEQGKSYSEKIRKSDDDMLDCLRYAVNSGIRPATLVGSVPIYEYDKRTGRIKGVIGGATQARR